MSSPSEESPDADADTPRVSPHEPEEMEPVVVTAPVNPGRGHEANPDRISRGIAILLIVLCILAIVIVVTFFRSLSGVGSRP
jgi:hypothetical protein